MKCFFIVLLFSLTSFGQAITPMTPYSPSRIEWININLNVRIFGFTDKNKPTCVVDNPKKIWCLGFLASKARNKVFREQIRAEFDKLSKQLEVIGQITLDLSEY